ncbi:glycoside hydrolase family 92 protein [Mucilaginibacter hurinus]|uniref:Glycoside hydrolase family 92 protein n=1 Tax=Mucilaginibacter hurinus TaxID=2201324 RepID=A0A367GR79_9SPHI|nr:GH92 family glycosyl hydrolase [Mucilaginibacter hurinus]RCH55568.1 glycoside hydrolase family 92 protein [Mucilaginibacter hurinus]
MVKHVTFFFVAVTFTIFKLSAQNNSNLKYVDPTIGGVGLILEPTRPTVHLPNSLVRVYPHRKDQLDDQIAYYPLTVASHRVMSVFAFMAFSGKPQDTAATRFTYRRETLTPYYFNTTFENPGDFIEFTPKERSGIFRVTYGNGQNRYLRLGLLHTNGNLNLEGKRVLSGTENFAGMKAYFYAETDADLTAAPSSSGAKLLLQTNARVVTFKYGVSYISIAQAKQNLQKEIPGFDLEAVKQNARSVWHKTLSQISVEGGTEAQKRVFYSALYRCYERMVDINEYGRYYSGFDHKIHITNEPFYVDNWIWDTYIALEPLHMILDPKKEANKIRSYVSMYEQGGWMPSFAVVFGDWPAMVGNHAAAWMADAWFKGIRDFDVNKAYTGLKKNSLQGTSIPWRNGPATSLDTFYNNKGYIPGLPPGVKETVKLVDTVWEKRQSVSVTLENSYADWCLAQLSAETGNIADRDLFLNRAANYKNVYRTDKGFMWPKDDKGEWIEPFDPRFAGRDYFTENNAYTYNWCVKHDLKGLMNLMGGRNAAESKLDQLFREELGMPKFRFWTTQPDASGLVGQFVMGNEPSLHIPYLYNYMGAPWKSQKRIRMLLDAWFPDDYSGFPGDEDGGGMSGFVVFSMMGFMPVTPGIPVYNTGSPVFNKVIINLPNSKTFTVNAQNNSRTHVYVRQATLNGKPLNKPWFTHSDIVNGGSLNLIMSDIPNMDWGAGVNDAPPSAMEYRPTVK